MAFTNNQSSVGSFDFDDDDDDVIYLIEEFIPKKQSNNTQANAIENDDVIFVEERRSTQSVAHKIDNKSSKIDEYFQKLVHKGKKVSDSGHNNQENRENIDNFSLKDPRLEVLDPTPDIQKLFREFDEKFFCGILSKQQNFKVIWCNRLTTSAGIFKVQYNRRNNQTIRQIQLSARLLSLRPRSDLIDTLLHEMIHAYIYFTGIRDDDPHGQCFQEFMYKINHVAKTNITVYHNFRDEVKYVQQNPLQQVKKRLKRQKQTNQLDQRKKQASLDDWLII